ncbi:ATP-dependent DNA helicase PIF1 [Senna tora]|uniref:ATP-dependent DNA helicase PIF1 n=1 Tax=Senna tora TaxID=362788 RepID=A0A834X5D5_9FABA|nr:ATP-dependent DNA helicase PIF1 [Senna tora]
MYNGLQDSFEAGINISGHLGRRIILPSSIVSCPRDMSERFQDAMRVVGISGKPDLFLTMTCNPSWDEIRDLLLPGQLPQDRSDLLSRMSMTKLSKLKFPCKVIDQPELYTSVLKHMIHGPCVTINPRSPCMHKGKCKRHFPKPFVPYTVQGNDCYPLYQRRDMGLVPLGRGRNRVQFNEDQSVYEILGVMELWNEFHHFMMEDYTFSSNVNNVRSINRLLRDLDTLLSQHDKHIANYDLPTLIDDPEGNNDVPKCIEDELSIPISDTDMQLIDLLNDDQKNAFKSIIDAIE